MDNQHFYIKNMVCNHCAEVLESKLGAAGFDVDWIQLGEVRFKNQISPSRYTTLTTIVRENGFEIISNRNSQIVEHIKHLNIDSIHHTMPLRSNLSDFLSGHIHRDYQTLSRLFSSVEGKSIERYFILQKIERAKELIVYGDQNLTEIAYELGYSSQQHFSRQFKKETGLTPSHFKEVKENKRISIDNI